jgi:predicted metal-dependent hydrolase
VSSNLTFIENQLEEIKKIREQFPTKHFVEGEPLLFFGRERILRFRPGGTKPKVFMEGENLILQACDLTEAERREAIRSFYRKAGRKYLTHRLDFFSKAMKLAPKSVSFRSQSSRWGSCSGEGHISLNWRLMAAPPDVIDYVVIHELAHLRHHDHSSRFWALVAEFSPRAKQLKRWLNDHQWAFEFLAPAKDEETV